jgi:hypothetical protein
LIKYLNDDLILVFIRTDVLTNKYIIYLHETKDVENASQREASKL